MASPDASMQREDMDTSTNMLWIDPCVLADADQPFLIYSPSTKNYLFMSKDPALTHHLHTRLEAHETRLFGRNLFKLKKTDMEDKYYLFNLETEKYVYVSGEHVLGADDEPIDNSKKSKFVFSFETSDDVGLYKIRHQECYLHVSSVRAGIPACPVVKASSSHSSVFQFVLLKNARDALIKYNLERFEVQEVEVKELSKEFPNEGEEEISQTIDTDSPDDAKDSFEFQDGFHYTGTFTGGIPVLTISEDGDKKPVICSQDIPISANSFIDVLGRSCSSSLSSMKIAPGCKTIVKIVLRKSCFVVPFSIEVTTREKKVLICKGRWIGGYATSKAYHTRVVDIKDEGNGET